MESMIIKPFSRVSFSNHQSRRTGFLTPRHSPLFKSSPQINKPRISHLPISCKTPPNPKPSGTHYIYNLHITPFCLLLPALHSIRDFAASGIRNPLGKWVSCLRGFDGSIRCLEGEEGEYFQSGGIGTALLGATSLAKVRGGISPFLVTLVANPTFMSGLLAWAVAQSTKMLLNFFVERKWDFRILFSSGGMPSSHSALCTALTTSVALCHGIADSLFPVCLGFSLIVMYDATGVRRHAGMQAEVLNMIVEDLFQGHPISQRKLKELLGHTPSQVFAGALLGIVVSCFCCQGCLVAV